MSAPAPKRMSDVDLHVGRQLKAFRKANGLSQDALANQLGVKFQQVQKYENGTNRMSAGRLWQAARALGVGVGDFYDGLAA